MKTTSLLLGCLLAASPLPSAESAARGPAAAQTVLVLGDSLSDGFGLSRAQAYPALLARKARAAGLKVDIVNASASGGTTAGGLQRLPKHLDRPIDVLVVQLGINDAFRGVALDQIRANLQAIIDRARKRSPQVRVVIAGMRLPLQGSGYLDDFGSIFGELAEKNNAALVPYLLEGVGGDPTLNLPDHIHPNAAGQRIL
ncbi:MAG: arylesterase, partial [Chthoniobacterales bacterium]